MFAFLAKMVPIAAQMMSSLIELLVSLSVSTEHMKIKLAHDKVINNNLSTLEIKTISFFQDISIQVRGMYRVLVEKPEGKRPPGRPRRRWVDNIRMDLQEVGCGYMDWSVLAHDRDKWRMLVSAVMNLRVP